MTNENDNNPTNTDCSTPEHFDQLIKTAEAKEMKRLEKNRRAREKYHEEKSAQRIFQILGAFNAINDLAKAKGLRSD